MGDDLPTDRTPLGRVSIVDVPSTAPLHPLRGRAMSASDGTQGVRDHQHEIERIREPQPHFTHEAPEHWSELAACASADPEAWFPPKGNPPAHAKAICRRCPVISECLEAALARNDQWGVYGGMSLRERNKLAKDRREAAA